MSGREFTDAGIPGLSVILGGKGVPKGHTILVAGRPGSGKTTLAVQFLHSGATLHSEAGVYISLDEATPHLKTSMLEFGFDLEKLEEENKLRILDISPVRYRPASTESKTTFDGFNIGLREFEMRSLRQELHRAVSDLNAKRVVVDPVSILSLRYEEVEERHYAVIDLMQSLALSGCTSLITTELKGTSLEREYTFPEYLAQGVILLRTVIRESRLVRALQVAKIRGLNIDPEPRPYRIGRKGIEVYPNEKVL